MASPKKYKIILGVTGGIAAYKACELVRLYKKAGHDVRVVMTKAAEDFVGAITFQSLSGEPVLRSLDGSQYGATSHIELAQWGDALVVAPATANFFGKLAHGIADDALLTEALAFQGPVLIAPAMNTRMWMSPALQDNFKTLTARGVQFVGPESGDLACGETGLGKMSEPSAIFAATESLLAKMNLLSGKKVLITSGPTRAYIDEVRYITNRSSGRMGHALAARAEAMGAEVVLVTGPVEEKFATLGKGKVLKVETGAQMLSAALTEVSDADLVFAAAAVADFEMPEVLTGKIRREGNLALDLVPAVDVLAQLGKNKKPGQVFFGFAAEAGEGEAEFKKAADKIKKKNLDFLALNNISRSDIGFDAKENEVFVFNRAGLLRKIAKSGKDNVADELLVIGVSLASPGARASQPEARA